MEKSPRQPPYSSPPSIPWQAPSAAGWAMAGCKPSPVQFNQKGDWARASQDPDQLTPRRELPHSVVLGLAVLKHPRWICSNCLGAPSSQSSKKQSSKPWKRWHLHVAPSTFEQWKALTKRNCNGMESPYGLQVHIQGEDFWQQKEKTRLRSQNQGPTGIPNTSCTLVA